MLAALCLYWSPHCCHYQWNSTSEKSLYKKKKLTLSKKSQESSQFRNQGCMPVLSQTSHSFIPNLIVIGKSVGHSNKTQLFPMFWSSLFRQWPRKALAVHRDALIAMDNDQSPSCLRDLQPSPKWTKRVLLTYLVGIWKQEGIVNWSQGLVTGTCSCSSLCGV